MVNLDGFALTHTYESVDIPAQEQADAFLPPYDGAGNRFDFANPVNIGYSAGPEFNRYFKHSAHEGMLAAADAVERVEARSPRCSAELPGADRDRGLRRCRHRAGHAGFLAGLAQRTRGATACAA